LLELRERLAEFHGLDAEQRGALTRAEFLGALRGRLAAQDAREQLLEELWRTVDVDEDDTIDFEEFVAWTRITAFCESLLVSDPWEMQIRRFARQHNVNILDLEHIWKQYAKFDWDRSGDISKREFQDLLRVLLKSRSRDDISRERLDHFWNDADSDQSGSINFEEFLIWYRRYFNTGDDDLASTVYRKLGTDRTSSFYDSSCSGAETA